MYERTKNKVTNILAVQGGKNKQEERTRDEEIIEKQKKWVRWESERWRDGGWRVCM
jgi:hypothetical protein